MYNVTRLIHLADGVDDAKAAALIDVLHGAMATAAKRIVAPTLPGSRNGGTVLLHAQFPDQQSWESAAESRLDDLLTTASVTHLDGVDYDASPVPATGPAGTVYRTLLLAVDPATSPSIVEDFEADLLLMPRYVETITACRLSRPLRTLGASRWTHVFEQQFTDEAGLMGAYLMHPIHWGRVDRWFDPECPEYIVNERVCHSFCRMDHPVLT